MRKPFGFGTLESRIYTIFTLMIFAVIFIMQLVAFRFTINIVKASILGNNQALLGQLVTQIDSYINDMEKLVEAMVHDRSLQRYLEMKGKEEARRSIEERLANYLRTRNDISGILVVGEGGTVISGDSEGEINPWAAIEEQDWFISAREARGQTVISTSYVQNIIRERYPWVVSLSREIISSETGRFLGVLLLDLKFNRIGELCRSLSVGRRSYDFILDPEGNYIFHPAQQLVYSNIRSEPIHQIFSLLEEDGGEPYFDGERYFMVETSALTGWYAINVTYHGDITSDWRSVQRSYVLIGFIFFIIVGFSTNRISSGITKPVRKLQNIMKSVDTGDFQLVGNLRGTDELQELAREYDFMVTRIRGLMEANIREQELKRKSDLKALQAQINPHFLYNTLDSIIWMGEMGQNKEVVQMAASLSKLFRISISRGRELITIADETAHVQSYLTIQEMRYRDKFRYLIDIDSAIQDMKILKITLQPLVENAIYHGVKEVDYQGFIRITGRQEGKLIVLEVADNGRGMNRQELKDVIEEIESPLEQQGQLSRRGMGIRNVHERIRLYFGSAYGLSCTSALGKGTTFTVRVPITFQEVL